MKKSLFIALFAIFASCTAFAQTKTKLYNEKGTQITIVTKNWTDTYTCEKTGQFSYKGQPAGTWLDNYVGTGDTPFYIAQKKNEIIDRSRNLIVYIGSYNVETGACKVTRISDDASNGLTGTCTITVKK
jgi:phosphate-selective porin